MPSAAAKSIDAAKPGGGEYAVLRYDSQKKRFGPWPPVHTATGKRMSQKKQAHAALMLWTIADDFDGRVYDRSGNALAILVEAVNRHVDDSSDNMMMSAARTTCFDLICMGLVQRDGWSKGTKLLKLTLKKSQLPMPRPYKLERVTETKPEPEREVEANDFLTARLEAETDAHNVTDVPEPEAQPRQPASAEIDAFAVAQHMFDLAVQAIVRSTSEEPAPYLQVERDHYRDQANRQAQRTRVLETELEQKETQLKSVRSDLRVERDARQRLEDTNEELIRQIQQFRSREIVSEDARRAFDKMLREVPNMDKAYATTNGGR